MLTVMAGESRYFLGSESLHGSTSSFYLVVADSGLWHIDINDSNDPKSGHSLSEGEMLERSIGGVPLTQMIGNKLSYLYEHYMREPTRAPRA
jgi:hypothetical protein